MSDRRLLFHALPFFVSAEIEFVVVFFFLLAVFASSEVERVRHLVKGSACFASIQIRVPGYPASDALNGNTSTQAGK